MALLNPPVHEAHVLRYRPSISGHFSPGPGDYEPLKRLGAVDVNRSSIDGSFAQARRSSDVVPTTPGYLYNPVVLGPKVRGGGFGKAQRFQESKPSPGFCGRPRRASRPSSAAGTFGRAARVTLPSAATSLGPCYNVDPPQWVRPGPALLPRAERFPAPSDEGSPGPIYLPRSLHHVPTTRIPKAERFRYRPSGTPGPTTAAPGIDRAVARGSPAFSFRGKWLDSLPVSATPSPTKSRAPDPPHSAWSSDRLRLPTADVATGSIDLPKAKKAHSGTPAQDPVAVPQAFSRTPSPVQKRPVIQPSTHGPSPSRLRAFSPIPTVEPDPPGPGQYLGIVRLFENRPNHGGFTMRRQFPSVHQESPGPGTYDIPAVVGNPSRWMRNATRNHKPSSREANRRSRGPPSRNASPSDADHSSTTSVVCSP